MQECRSAIIDRLINSIRNQGSMIDSRLRLHRTRLRPFRYLYRIPVSITVTVSGTFRVVNGTRYLQYLIPISRVPQRPTEVRSTGPDRDRRSIKMGIGRSGSRFGPVDRHIRSWRKELERNFFHVVREALSLPLLLSPHHVSPFRLHLLSRGCTFFLCEEFLLHRAGTASEI